MEDWGGVFVSKEEEFRYEIISDYIEGKLSGVEASLLLDISERQITRLANKHL